MRWLFIFIFIALFANAYDAGRHVFGVTFKQTKLETMAGMDCCPPEKDKAQSATTACHYCCSGLLACAPVLNLQPARVPDQHDFVVLVDLDGETSDSLFRPPRLFG
ncbi:MAG TPA: hypothetical protein VFS88_06515 [Micavibrio sp.]|nr:hypothetical protein [Micavibrio sp.]